MFALICMQPNHLLVNWLMAKSYWKASLNRSDMSLIQMKLRSDWKGLCWYEIIRLNRNNLCWIQKMSYDVDVYVLQTCVFFVLWLNTYTKYLLNNLFWHIYVNFLFRNVIKAKVAINSCTFTCGFVLQGNLGTLLGLWEQHRGFSQYPEGGAKAFHGL